MNNCGVKCPIRVVGATVRKSRGREQRVRIVAASVSRRFGLCHNGRGRAWLRDPRQLSLNLVEAHEIDPPPGEDPIVWRLLTTHAATSLAEATRIIDLYRCR